MESRELKLRPMMIGLLPFLAGGVLLGTTALAQDGNHDAVSTQLAATTLVGAEGENLDDILLGQQQLDGEAIEARNAEDFEDLFRNMLGVRAGGGRLQSQDVYIQGLQSTMASVSIDGTPQGGLIFYHAGSAGSIEPELLKSVTVSAGTSNALSGPGALGGSLVYETKDGFDLLAVDQQFGAKLKATLYATSDMGSKLTAQGYGRLGEDWSYLVSVGSADVGNYKDGKGDEVIDTQYKRKNALAKASGSLSESQKLSVSFETIEDEGRGGARFNVYPDEASELANYKKRDTWTVHYDYDPVDRDWLALEATFYHTERTLDGSDETNGITTEGFDLRNTSLYADGDISVAYGIDFQDTANTSSLVAEDEAGNILGFYAQADWSLSEAWLVSLGSRFDQYELDPRTGEGLEHSGFSPNATLLWKPSDQLRIHGSIAKSFRGATPIMSKLTSATTDPDMDPEKAQNIELGLEYAWEVYYVTAKIFRTEVDDLIDPRPRNVARNNIGDLESEGYELSLGARTRSLQLQLGVSQVDPEITTTDGSVYEEYVSVANKTGRVWLANVDYNFEKTGLSVGWTTEYVESTTAVGSRSTREKGSTLVHDAFVSWSPVSDQWSGLSANLSVSNVFDKAYYEQTTFAYLNGYAAPGRDVRFSLSYEF